MIKQIIFQAGNHDKPKTALKWLEEYHTLDNVMKNSEAIPGVVGENLRKAKDWLPTGKDLITIRCNLDINVDWKELEKKAPHLDELKKIYKEFNFSTWLKELEQEPSDVNSEKQFRRNSSSKYQLNYTLTIKEEKGVVSASQTLERYSLFGSLKYSLTDKDGGVVLTNTAKSFTAYSATGTPLATERAKRDAQA